MGIEEMQNVSKLKKCTSDEARVQLPPPPLRKVVGGGIQEVEKIVDYEKAGTNMRNWTYRVRWKGFGEEEDAWLSQESLKNAKKIVEDYHEEHGLNKPIWKLTKKEREERYGKVKRIIIHVPRKGEDSEMLQKEN